MKTSNGYKIWQIVYPVGMYYVVSSLVYFALELLLGSENETYMLRQMCCAAATIPVILSFYRQDSSIEAVVYEKKKWKLDKSQVKNMLYALVTGALLGIAVNNILAMTPLLQKSNGFQTANEAFFGGEVLYEILGSCLVVPLAEELLFRGVVYKRLKMQLGVRPAIVLSAVIFGAMHFNTVQFLYAAILGLLLAFLLEKTGYFYAPVLGHIAANAMAVVRQETGWLDFSYQPTASGIGFTAAVFFVAMILIYLMVKEYRTQTK